ncbi:MAG: HD domain-containing phosphohydrolase [Nitrospinota bacterium]
MALPNLPWGTPAPVDLYMLKEKDLSLLFRSQQALSPESYNDIRQTSDRLYYDRDAQVNWQSLVDANLTNILQTPLATEAKAAVAYGSVARKTQEIFQDFSAAGVETAKETVITLNKLMEEPKAIESFFQLTIHDYYTYTHSVHVYIYAMLLTRAVIGGDNTKFLDELGLGYLLHDIGKKDISPDILNKKGKLDENEWATIKSHPLIGYDLLTQATGKLTDEVTQIVLQHHEKCDGSGYPKGLKDTEIGRYGKLCAIADVYDALTTRRSYKEALSKMAAFTIMQDSKGHFDHQMLTRFIRLAVPFVD